MLPVLVRSSITVVKPHGQEKTWWKGGLFCRKLPHHNPPSKGNENIKSTWEPGDGNWSKSHGGTLPAGSLSLPSYGTRTPSPDWRHPQWAGHSHIRKMSLWRHLLPRSLDCIKLIQNSFQDQLTAPICFSLFTIILCRWEEHFLFSYWNFYFILKFKSQQNLKFCFSSVLFPSFVIKFRNSVFSWLILCWAISDLPLLSI